MSVLPPSGASVIQCTMSAMPSVILAMPLADAVADELACLGVLTRAVHTPDELLVACCEEADTIAAVVIAVGPAFHVSSATSVRELDASIAVPVLVHLDDPQRTTVLAAYAAGATDVLMGELDLDLLRAKIAALADLWDERRAAHVDALAPSVPELQESILNATVEIAAVRARNPEVRDTLVGVEQHLRRLSWVVGRLPSRPWARASAAPRARAATSETP